MLVLTYFYIYINIFNINDIRKQPFIGDPLTTKIKRNRYVTEQLNSYPFVHNHADWPAIKSPTPSPYKNKN